MSIRRQSRSAAPFVLFVWLTGLVLPLFGAGHGMGLDDPACVRPLWAQSSQVDILQKDVRSTDDGHCGICHLQRAVRGALHSVTRTVEYAAATGVDRPIPQYHLAGADRDVSSPRAPPSVLA
jgi:hypothetical protein